MKKLLIILSLILTSLTVAPPAYAVGQQSVNLYAKATTTTGRKGVFEKYLFSFPTPNNFNFIGISGYISITSNSTSLEQALVPIWVLPSGACPTSGEEYDTYPLMNPKYAGRISISQFIVKAVNPGTVTLPIEFTLPVKTAMTGCVFIGLDGGDPGTGDPLTMESHLTLNYDTDAAPSPVPSRIPINDEFCYGQNTGCQKQSLCTAPTCAIANSIPITKSTNLLAISGSVATGTLPAHIPTGNWSSTFDYYLYKSCTLPNGLSGPSDLYSQIPADAVHLLQVVEQGSKKTSVNTPVFKTFSPIAVEPGNCLVHLSKPNTANGGFTAESQLFVQTQTAVAPSPTAPSAKSGDISSDGVNYTPDGIVNYYDYSRLASDYNKSGTPGWLKSDMSGINGVPDGKVDYYDYKVIVANYGK